MAYKGQSKKDEASEKFRKGQIDEKTLIFTISATEPSFTLVKNLLKGGADPTLPDGDTILMKYSASGLSVDALLKIPSVKRVINVQNKGETAFSLAVNNPDHWHQRNIAGLVSHGAKDTTALCSSRGVSNLYRRPPLSDQFRCAI